MELDILIITEKNRFDAELSSAYHIQDAPDPGPAGLPDPDGGVDDLDGDEPSGDGADPRAAEEAALGGQADEPASDRAQEQAGCTQDDEESILFLECLQEKKRERTDDEDEGDDSAADPAHHPPVPGPAPAPWQRRHGSARQERIHGVLPPWSTDSCSDRSMGGR
jgi:hypothetical protein